MRCNLIKLQLQLLRFLNWSRGLECYLSIAAFAWSIGVLLERDQTSGRKETAMAMIILQLARHVAKSWHWRYLRHASHWGAVGLWGGIAVERFPYLPAAFLLGTLACAELLVGVRVVLGLDVRENPLGVALQRPDVIQTVTQADSSGEPPCSKT